MPILTSGYVQIARGDKVRLAMDFGDIPQLIDGATIVTHDVTCATTGAPAITGENLDYPYQLSALFDATAATAGSYEILFTITLNDSNSTVIARTGGLKVL